MRLVPMINSPPYHLVAMETHLCLCMCAMRKQNKFVRSAKIWVSFPHTPLVLSTVLAWATLSVLDYTLARSVGLHAAACYERPPLVSFVSLSASLMPCRCCSETWSVFEALTCELSARFLSSELVVRNIHARQRWALRQHSCKPPRFFIS